MLIYSYKIIYLTKYTRRLNFAESDSYIKDMFNILISFLHAFSPALSHNFISSNSFLAQKQSFNPCKSLLRNDINSRR